MRTQQSAGTSTSELLSWRRRQLVAAGFRPTLASHIARDPAFDLHALIELVERGCPPTLAVRILAPIEDRPWIRACT
ncbi:MAG TPA: hypothetical protein VE688_09085 [Gaiellaceae bacterium]|jgi:hypothetical protein|nr:hypothetical protein [Gaiellaceae bacterium]